MVNALTNVCCMYVLLLCVQYACFAFFTCPDVLQQQEASTRPAAACCYLTVYAYATAVTGKKALFDNDSSE